MIFNFRKTTPFLLLLITACGTTNPPVNSTTDTVTVAQNPPSDSALLQTATDATLQALAAKDFNALGQLVHPEKGLLFSPYGYVDAQHAVRFKPAEVARMFTTDTAQRKLWGFQDGSGDSLLLTPPAYFRRYVYSRDFKGSDSFHFRKIPQRGNTLNNLAEVFPEGIVVESYTPGTLEMDWRALRMVFEKMADNYYLVALVNDEWTI